MRDELLYAHILLALAVAVIAVIIIRQKNKSPLTKNLSILGAVVSWISVLPAGLLYLNFYPATKTLILSNAWPWAHEVIMETKEHWGLLVPVFATVAAWLVLTGKEKESKKWWTLVLVMVVLIGIFGRLVKLGALA